jgi:hypothetical protein
MKAQLIDPAELEQREVMRRNAIANAAMEIVKGLVTNPVAIKDTGSKKLAAYALEVATEIFDYVQPSPVASRLTN